MIVMCTSTIAIAAVVCIGFITDSEEVNPNVNYNYLEQRMEDSETVHEEECDSQIKHDWECNYIIVECMSNEGEHTYHYVDDYIRNVDHSITFIGEDGLLTTVHYPYFQIIVNPKTKN